MLGSWSLGDYFKKEAITWSFEFLTKVLNIPVERLAVTVYEGDNKIPRDEVSANIWKKLVKSRNETSKICNPRPRSHRVTRGDGTRGTYRHHRAQVFNQRLFLP